MAIDAALSAPWDGEVKNFPQPVQARVQCSALSLDGPTAAVFQLAEAAWVRSDPGINAFAGTRLLRWAAARLAPTGQSRGASSCPIATRFL
jgi:hypothetical protein